MHKTYKLDLTTVFILFSSLISYVFVYFLEITASIFILQYTLITLSMTLFVLLLSRKAVTKKDIFLLMPFLLLNIVYILRIEEVTGQVILNIVSQISFVLLMFILYKIKMEKNQLKLMSFFSLVVFVLLMTSLSLGLINNNTIGAYAYFFSFIPLLYIINYGVFLPRIKGLSLLILMLTLVYLSGTRSILLAIFFSVVTFFSWKLISARKGVFYTYFILLISFVFSMVVLYPKIYLLKNFHKYNEFSYQITGKSLLSGRDAIWEELFEIIKLKPLLGHGAHLHSGDFIQSGLGAHNLYLQISLQVGLVGVFLLILFLFILWKLLWSVRSNKSARLTASFFTGILIYQTFELSLIQGNFGLGILQWVIIGLGLSYACKDKKLRPF